MTEKKNPTIEEMEKKVEAISEAVSEKIKDSNLSKIAKEAQADLQKLITDAVRLAVSFIGKPDHEVLWQKEKRHLVARAKGIRALAERRALEEIFQIILGLVPEHIFPAGRLADFLRV